MENKNLSWEALEFQTHQRSKTWYLIFVLVAASLIAYSIYRRDILTLVTFIVLILATLVLLRRQPQVLQYQLNSIGIVTGEISYPYRNIKKFWIIYNSQNKTLNFQTTAYLNSHITIQLGKQEPLAVKQFLKTYLVEDLDQEESLTDILARKIKF